MTKIHFGRILKLGISVVFFSACSVRDTFLELLGSRRKGYCVVLYYHAVASTDREPFSRQMDMLLRWARPVVANCPETCRPGERWAVVTFDDGLESVVENALPELQCRQIPSTIFIVPESLGQPPIWMAPSPGPINGRRVMSREQLRNLDAKLVTVGSHSLTHPNLSQIEITEARRQISDSRTVLRDILGREISLFSFPYGAFNDQLVKACRDAGYARVFTSLPALALTDSNEFVLGRVGVEPTDWPLEFRLKLLGAYRWLPGAIALKRRLKSPYVRASAVAKSLRAEQSRRDTN